MTDEVITGVNAPDRGEPHQDNISGRLNWLRAGVLGANDGIVSTAGIVIGMAGATTSRTAIVTAGIAGLTAGAMSMAVGEYVSVSSQKDTEKAMLSTERRELEETPEEELQELTDLYAAKGLDGKLAKEVATQLTAHDALGAHAEAELGIDPENLTSPTHAAVASFIAFTLGSLLPLIAIALPPTSWRVPIAVFAVVLALAGTGVLAARLGSAPIARALWRNVIGGMLAMAVTYSIGTFVGRAV
jgi:VIT1/CCC1 family predicted Fe2+/Mn2+ transporter